MRRRPFVLRGGIARGFAETAPEDGGLEQTEIRGGHSEDGGLERENSVPCSGCPKNHRFSGPRTRARGRDAS